MPPAQHGTSAAVGEGRALRERSRGVGTSKASHTRSLLARQSGRSISASAAGSTPKASAARRCCGRGAVSAARGGAALAALGRLGGAALAALGRLGGVQVAAASGAP